MVSKSSYQKWIIDDRAARYCFTAASRWRCCLAFSLSHFSTPRTDWGKCLACKHHCEEKAPLWLTELSAYLLQKLVAWAASKNWAGKLGRSSCGGFINACGQLLFQCTWNSSTEKVVLPRQLPSISNKLPMVSCWLGLWFTSASSLPYLFLQMLANSAQTSPPAFSLKFISAFF